MSAIACHCPVFAASSYSYCNTPAPNLQDSLIKLWDMKNFFDQKSHFSQVEPYLTIRGYPGAIFTITGTSIESNLSQHQFCTNVIYSAGQQGEIQAWRIPYPEQCDPYEISDGKNYMLSVNPGPLSQAHAHSSLKSFLPLCYFTAFSLLLCALAENLMNIFGTHVARCSFGTHTPKWFGTCRHTRLSNF